MKRTFTVAVREVHLRHYSVQAENEEEAKDLVYQMHESVTDMGFEEYSHSLDREAWSVEESPDKDDSSGQHQEDTVS